VALADAITVNEGATVTTLDSGAASVLANDSDADLPNDTLSATIGVGPAHGSLTLNADGTFSYTHDGTENFSDVFTYIVSDADGGVSDTGTVSITVNPFNDAPTTSPVTLAAIAEDSGARTITQAELLANAADIEGDSLTAAGLTISAGGGALVDNLDGTWDYAPAANDDTSVSFSYTISDGTDTVAGSATMDITPVNDAPVIGGVNTGAATEDLDPDSDGLLEVSGALTVADADTGESNFQATTIAGTYGSLTIDGAGTWHYSADTTQTAIQQLDIGESVSEVLTVTTADGTAHNVTVTINGAEDAAVIGGTASGTVNVDGPLTDSGQLIITDADAGDNPVNFADAAATSGDNGYGTFAITGGVWTYTLDTAQAAVQALQAGDTLTDTHTFTASDGSAQVVTVTISGADNGADNDPPPTVGGGNDPVPDDDPIDPDPDPLPEPEPEPVPEPIVEEILPVEDDTPAPENIGSPATKSSNKPDIAVMQGNFPHYTVPTISSTAAQQNEAPEVESSVFQYVRQQLATRMQAHFSPVAAVFFSSETMAQELDHIQSQIDEYLKLESEQGQLIIGTAASLGASVFVGYVVWAFRGAGLLFGALSAMPMWRCFDPLPVLLGNEKKRDREEEDKQGKSDPEGDEQHIRDLLDGGPEAEGQP
jgi:VCBS repeat-containing protein